MAKMKNMEELLLFHLGSKMQVTMNLKRLMKEEKMWEQRCQQVLNSYMKRESKGSMLIHVEIPKVSAKP